MDRQPWGSVFPELLLILFSDIEEMIFRNGLSAWNWTGVCVVLMTWHNDTTGNCIYWRTKCHLMNLTRPWLSWNVALLKSRDTHTSSTHEKYWIPGDDPTLSAWLAPDHTYSQMFPDLFINSEHKNSGCSAHNRLISKTNRQNWFHSLLRLSSGLYNAYRTNAVERCVCIQFYLACTTTGSDYSFRTQLYRYVAFHCSVSCM